MAWIENGKIAKRSTPKAAGRYVEYVLPVVFSWGEYSLCTDIV